MSTHILTPNSQVISESSEPGGQSEQLAPVFPRCPSEPTPADRLIATLFDIARVPERCEAEESFSNKTDAMRCGRRTVKCPKCKKESGLCAEHLWRDEELLADYPEGVCVECMYEVEHAFIEGVQ